MALGISIDLQLFVSSFQHEFGDINTELLMLYTPRSTRIPTPSLRLAPSDTLFCQSL